MKCGWCCFLVALEANGTDPDPPLYALRDRVVDNVFVEDIVVPGAFYSAMVQEAYAPAFPLDMSSFQLVGLNTGGTTAELFYPGEPIDIERLVTRTRLEIFRWAPGQVPVQCADCVLLVVDNAEQMLALDGQLCADIFADPEAVGAQSIVRGGGFGCVLGSDRAIRCTRTR